MLRELFGGEVHPRPPADTLTSFVATVLMELSDAAVIQMEPEYFDTPRSDVGQGPLIKVSRDFTFFLPVFPQALSHSALYPVKHWTTCLFS